MNVLVPILLIFFVVTYWKIFSKANQSGWIALIPLLNLIVFMLIIKKPAILLLLLLIPIVNIFFAISFVHSLSKSFGNDVGFTIGLLFLPFIFYPILAFGNHQYIYAKQKNYDNRDTNNSFNSNVEFK